MDRSTIIYLVHEIRTQDEIGQFISHEELRQVYCDVRSITQTEWFEAGRNGLQPMFKVVMFEPDYQGETMREYNNRRYAIYRTYRGRNDAIELYVEAKGGTHGKNKSKT